MKHIKPQEKERQVIRVAVIRLQTILKNKDNEIAELTTYLPVLTLNVNRLNSTIKRHHLANWIVVEDPIICCLQEAHLIDRNQHWLRLKGWNKIYQANGPPKQARLAILTSDKVGFKHTLGKRGK
jgi:hypothetical protein